MDELSSSIENPTKFANLWQLIQDNFEIIFINENSIDQLKQTILQLAVMGKLVRQDYKDMSAADLTKKMKREKEQLYKEGSLKKQKKLASIHQEEIPFKLPKNWEIARLGDLSHIISKGTTPTSIGFKFEDSGVSFVKIENIENGRIDSGSISQFISEETNNALSRSQLKKGDILFSIAGTIGKTAIVFEEDLPCNTNQGLAFIRGTDSIYYPRYLQIQLDSFVAEKTRQRARGGAMPNVSLTDIKELVSPLPPLEEQKRIINKVDELFDMCEQLKENISKKQNTQIRLAESLVEQALT